MPLTSADCKTLELEEELFLNPEKVEGWLFQKWEEIESEGMAYCYPSKTVYYPCQWGDGEMRGVYLGIFPKDRFENFFHFEFFISLISHKQQKQFQTGNIDSYNRASFLCDLGTQKNTTRDFKRNNIKQFHSCLSYSDLQSISEMWFAKLPKEFDDLRTEKLLFGSGNLDDSEAGLGISTPESYISFFVVDDVFEGFDFKPKVSVNKSSTNFSPWWKFW